MGNTKEPKKTSPSSQFPQIHTDHRARLKERFRQEGGEHFTDAQLLELMLFAAIPRKDVNPLAHILLRHFGSFSAVLEADEQELKRVEGIGESAAFYLTTFLPVIRRYLQDKNQVGTVLITPEQFGQYLLPKYIGLREEAVYLLCFDAKSKLIYEGFINSGTPLFSVVSIRKITEIVTRTGAISIVVAHNHPNGLAIPSEDDLSATEALRNAMTLMETQLLDHVILAGDDFVSLRQTAACSGLFTAGREQQKVANLKFRTKQ